MKVFCTEHSPTQNTSFGKVLMFKGIYLVFMVGPFYLLDLPPPPPPRPPPAEMSPGDKRAMQKALTNGTSTFVHGRVIIVGPGRGGKSALLRSLLRKKFEILKSTIGFNVEKTSCILWTEDGRLNFEVDDPDQQIVRLTSKVIKDDLKVADVQLQPSSHPRAIISNTDSQLPPRPNISSKVTALVDDFIAKLEANMLDPDSLNSRACLDFWDFAGQKPFQALGHMLFDDERCCFVIVFDSRKFLENAIFQDLWCDEHGENLDLETSSETYIANFEKWLNVITQTAGKDTPVYVVGTHTDELRPEDRSAKAKEIEDKIWQIAKKNGLIEYLDDVFLLTNKGSGTEQEDLKLKELREAVSKSAKDKFELEVPIKYLPFAVVARQFAAKNLPLLSYSDACTLARAACQDDDVEVSALLKYYQVLGQIVQYESSVIIDTNWLMKAVSTLFAPLATKRQDKEYRDAYEDLFERGILSESLALHRWRNDADTKPLSTDMEARSVVFQLLGKYKLIYELSEGGTLQATPGNNRQYFVPFLVHNLPPAPSTCSEEQTPPHYILCEERKVFPDISFWCCVLSLMQCYGLRRADLTMYCDEAKLLICDRFQLQLKHVSRGIMLAMSDEDDDLNNSAFMSKEVVDKLLKGANELNALSRLKVNLFHAVACKCSAPPCAVHSVAGCSLTGCLHFALIKDEEKAVRCPLRGNDRAVVAQEVAMRRFWLPPECKLVSKGKGE